MNREKIAIIVDSGTDVPEAAIQNYGMYTIPLLVRYQDGTEYRSGIDITSDEILDRLSTEVPKTSLPSMEGIQDTIADILAEGYEKIIAVTISSGLSGTHNAIQLVAKNFPQTPIAVVDTKNIGIGAGMTALLAGELVAEGKLSYEEILQKLQKSVGNTKIFFCVETLEYLRKGGRIGLVASVLGTALQLKPIITCNADGIYETVSKTRGRNQSIKKALACAMDFVGGCKNFRVVVAHGRAAAEAAALLEEAKRVLPDAKEYFESLVSAALVVHTGPGLLGIGIQRLD